jgi:hypothetical protein
MELLPGVVEDGVLTMRQALVAGTDPVYARRTNFAKRAADVVALVTIARWQRGAMLQTRNGSQHLGIPHRRATNGSAVHTHARTRTPAGRRALPRSPPSALPSYPYAFQSRRLGGGTP